MAKPFGTFTMMRQHTTAIYKIMYPGQSKHKITRLTINRHMFMFGNTADYADRLIWEPRHYT